MSRDPKEGGNFVYGKCALEFGGVVMRVHTPTFMTEETNRKSPPFLINSLVCFYL